MSPGTAISSRTASLRPHPELAGGSGIDEDRWLSERFCHPVFTVRALGRDRISEQVRAHARKQGRAMYQAKVPVDRTDVAAELTRAGFAVVNTGLVLAAAPRASGGPAGVEIRDANAGADDPIIDLARRAFWASRFHLDPVIPADVANRIKADWIANCLSGRRGDRVLVAVVAGDPVGFLATMASDGEERCEIIDLIAVDSSARGRGVGASLVGHLLADVVGRRDVVRVGTQAANVGATRFYERLGFVLSDAAYDLHLHVRNRGRAR